MKRLIISIFALALALSMICGTFVACGGEKDPQETDPAATNDPASQTDPDAPTDPIVPDNPTNPVDPTTPTEPQDETSAEPPADTGTATEPEAPTSGTITTNWNLGYVGSDLNENNPLRINASASSSYSYTDVIEVPKKGTKIVFIDNNLFDGGDGKFASTSIYVVSSWKKGSTGEWELDLEGTNVRGSSAEPSVIAEQVGDGIAYTYVTAKDNECIRLCFRAGKRAEVLADEYPSIVFNVTGEKSTADLMAEAETDTTTEAESGK